VTRYRSPQQYHVFVSYSHQDRWIAKQCARQIEEAGRGRIKTFLDEKDLEAGESIPDSIRRSIKRCHEFIVLLSRYSKDRPWVLIEMGAAWALGKRIVAIMDKVGPKDMPDIISSFKGVDLNDFDQYLTQLLHRATSERRK
jgi:TIR domain